DANGTPLAITFDYGTIESYRTQKIDGKNSFDVYQVRGDDNAQAMFEFLSTNTNVEWSMAKTGLSGNRGLVF
ncbi:MAG: hypothetical protein IJ328_06525, partial [Muribaculaceae bacterium]|nr:hypothetical protein [Muribaculaceae bacterium]